MRLKLYCAVVCILTGLIVVAAGIAVMAGVGQWTIRPRCEDLPSVVSLASESRNHGVFPHGLYLPPSDLIVVQWNHWMEPATRAACEMDVEVCGTPGCKPMIYVKMR